MHDWKQKSVLFNTLPPVKLFNTVPPVTAGTASVIVSQGSNSRVDMNETCMTKPAFGPNWLPLPVERGDYPGRQIHQISP